MIDPTTHNMSANRPATQEDFWSPVSKEQLENPQNVKPFDEFLVDGQRQGSTISCFGEESRDSQVGLDFLDSINVRGVKTEGKYFSIDFTDDTVRKGDHCKYNKTSEMRVDEFWEELTACSRDNLRTLIADAKMSGVNAVRHRIDNLEIMFKKPDVVLSNSEVVQSSFLVRNYSSIVTKPTTGECFFTDFSGKTYKMTWDAAKKSGSIHKIPYLLNPVASLGLLQEENTFILAGEVGRGKVTLWDHHIGRELIVYKLSRPDSTACFIAVEGDTMAVLEDNNIISVFNIKSSTPIHIIRAFENRKEEILSFQLAYNQIMLGTIEGPIVIPLNCSEPQESVMQQEAPGYKALYIKKGVVATAEIGSDKLTILSEEDKACPSQEFCLEDEKIIDFAVNPQTGIVAIVSASCRNSKKFYLRTVSPETAVHKRWADSSFKGGKSSSTYNWEQYLKLSRMPYRVFFANHQDILVVDDQHFCTFNTTNSLFVAALKEKLGRYLRA